MTTVLDHDRSDDVATWAVARRSCKVIQEALARMVPKTPSTSCTEGTGILVQDELRNEGWKTHMKI